MHSLIVDATHQLDMHDCTFSKLCCYLAPTSPHTANLNGDEV